MQQLMAEERAVNLLNRGGVRCQYGHTQVNEHFLSPPHLQSQPLGTMQASAGHDATSGCAVRVPTAFGAIGQPCLPPESNVYTLLSS